MQTLISLVGVLVLDTNDGINLEMGLLKLLCVRCEHNTTRSNMRSRRAVVNCVALCDCLLAFDLRRCIWCEGITPTALLDCLPPNECSSGILR